MTILVGYSIWGFVVDMFAPFVALVKVVCLYPGVRETEICRNTSVGEGVQYR